MRGTLPRIPEDRPSAAKRGYGRRWQKLRAMQLRREPLCRTCKGMGEVVVATEVDHVVAKARGGINSLGNLQSLCHMHHSQKTARDDGGLGHG